MGRRVMKPEEILPKVYTGFYDSGEPEILERPYDLSMIVATAAYGVIGARWSNKLLWHYPNDLKRFKEVTVGKTIVMGVQTYKDIGRTLPDRRNIVLTKRSYGKNKFKPNHVGIEVCYSPLKILELAETEPVVIIGGLSVYELFYPFVHTIYSTRIHGIYNGNVRFHLRNHGLMLLEESKTFPADDTHLYPYTFDIIKGQSANLESIKYSAANNFDPFFKNAYSQYCTDIIDNLNDYLVLIEDKPIITVKPNDENLCEDRWFGGRTKVL